MPIHSKYKMEQTVEVSQLPFKRLSNDKTKLEYSRWVVTFSSKGPFVFHLTIFIGTGLSSLDLSQFKSFDGLTQETGCSDELKCKIVNFLHAFKKQRLKNILLMIYLMFNILLWLELLL